MNIKKIIFIVLLFILSILIVYFWLPSNSYMYGNNGKLIINELMSKNTISYMDDNNEYSDWIELYNGYNYDIDLSGYHLSDSEYETDLWEFSDVTIKAKSYLIVFASGKDRCIDNVCHTNFRLGSSGEVVTLTDSTGTIISKITYKGSKNDISYGYNGRRYVYYEDATPLSKNSKKYSREPIGVSNDDISVYINEYMSSNKRLVTDGVGEYHDIIELYNYSDEDIDLSGYYLSDSINNLDKYMFRDTIIKAHDYLIIYASGNIDNNNDEVHTNFSISDNDDYLVLSTYDGKIIDKIEIVNLKDNISYGRGKDEFCYYMYPTIGYFNDTKCFKELN